MTRRRGPVTEWSKEDTHFKIVKQGTLAYEALTSEGRVRGALGQPSTILYDSVALRYNECDPGDLFMFNLPTKPELFNLRKNFRARGLKETDYRLFRPLVDETGKRYHRDRRPVAVQRLTNARMIPIEPFPREAAVLAKEAELRGATAFLARGENPVNPRPADEFSAGNENVVNT